ncbi:uncharacterized protein LOC134192746 isoform X2 [Corticium candelabrum]|uniref:uncharacterized protein LOC134192746 isoform X2 n=1 Tax=Corticium candelabrum TaxID=121492 RepID=UPI002E26FD6D|nr:uncharacterized protein LOC134192746 isoform X2 [Corticium candelabrum]
MPTGDKGNENGPPFISMTEDSTLHGVTIYYPNQPGNQVPTPFPWTLSLSGNNVAVTDVECLNCFNAIRAVGAHRHYIARVQGQPINMGVLVDQTYDVGRIEDVHWNPWYSNTKEYMSWQLLYGRAFVFARTDWEYVFNTFAFGYAIGYHFVASPQGSCNGNFLGIGADMMANASVQVDSSDAFGILITNGEFTAFVDSHFGTQLGGSGTTGFADCTFTQWDDSKQGHYAIEVNGATGNLLVNNCDFQYEGNQINLGNSTTLARAVITGNVIKGATRISGKAHNTQKGLNADSTSTP